MVAVEGIRRPVDFGGKRREAVAVRDLRARKEAEEHIRFLAHHDQLTGIPNRNCFNSRLDQEIERSLARRERLAVLCLDLDRFKEVNDLFGHSTGDALLQSVASCLTGVLAEDQLAARLGGDEFAIILPAISGPLAAGRVAESVLEALRADNHRSTTAALVSTSIGIALYPDDATDRHALLSHADTALYRAKADGRGTYRFFEARMGEEVRDRRLLEHDLRHAVMRGELRLVYQPQKNMQTGEIIGLEALLRWKHPTRGEVSPSLFIPIAEDSGSILQIGEWVLRTACAEAARWTRPLTVAVNVSTVQLHNANFAHLVHEVLVSTGLPPRRLEIEITETALISDLNRALGTLRQLKALGIRIAMDDFGTGYSSLSNLRAFQFDKIKIDGSFIRSVDRNNQAAAIVRAVLGLGQGLGLPVLAEGVETASELQFLSHEAACTEVQGFLIRRPCDIAQLRDVTDGDVAPGDAMPGEPDIPQPQLMAG
jgi:diguanylate cyclase (GGDEF)-like protein